MKKALRSLFPPLLSLVIVILGNSFFSTFANIRLSHSQPSWLVGFFSSAHNAGILVGCLYMERLIRQIGHIRSFALFASMNATMVMLQTIITHPSSIIFFRFLSGLCASGFFIIVESWLLLLSSPQNKGKILSLYMLSLYLAQSSGQFILNIIDLNSFNPFCFSVILCCCSIIPVCMLSTTSPPLPESPRIKIRQIAKDAPLGFISCILSGMIISVFMGLGPLYGKEAHFSVWQISQMMGLTILGGLTLQWPIGYLSNFYDRRKVFYNVCLVLIAICAALSFSARLSFPLFLLLNAAFGGFAFTLYPLSVNYTNDRVTSANTTTIICVMLTLYGIGCIIGPLIVPHVMAHFGHDGFYLYMAVLTTLLYLFGRSRFGRHNVPHEEAFVVLPSTSIHAGHLKPSSEESIDR
jgi:MFS family permease